MEFKLNQARELLSNETSIRKKVENERETLAQKWEMVRELISDNGNNDDTRLKLAKLEASVSTSRRFTNIFSPGGPTGLSPVCEGDSTASILDASDLCTSFENTRDTLGDESRLRSGRNYKRKSSGMGVSQLNKMDRSRRSRSKGGVHARKSLEAMAARKSGAGVIETNNKKRTYEERNIDDYLPSAPAQDDDAVVAW